MVLLVDNVTSIDSWDQAFWLQKLVNSLADSLWSAPHVLENWRSLMGFIMAYYSLSIDSTLLLWGWWWVVKYMRSHLKIMITIVGEHMIAFGLSVPFKIIASVTIKSVEHSNKDHLWVEHGMIRIMLSKGRVWDGKKTRHSSYNWCKEYYVLYWEGEM